MQDHAPTIYAYPSLQALFDGEGAAGAKAALPGRPKWRHGAPGTRTNGQSR